jgi:CBS domain-containing protein
MNITNIISRRPVTATPSVSLAEIARLMYDNRVGTVILTLAPADRPVAVGIITDRDVIRAQVERGADLSRIAASQAMTADPLSVRTSDGAEDVLSRMRERGVRRAVVVDDSGALTGIVSVDDIVLSLAEQVTAISRLLERQAVHSAQHVSRTA